MVLDTIPWRRLLALPAPNDSAGRGRNGGCTGPCAPDLGGYAAIPGGRERAVLGPLRVQSEVAEDAGPEPAIALGCEHVGIDPADFTNDNQALADQVLGGVLTNLGLGLDNGSVDVSTPAIETVVEVNLGAGVVLGEVLGFVVSHGRAFDIDFKAARARLLSG